MKRLFLIIFCALLAVGCGKDNEPGKGDDPGGGGGTGGSSDKDAVELGENSRITDHFLPSEIMDMKVLKIKGTPSLEDYKVIVKGMPILEELYMGGTTNANGYPYFQDDKYDFKKLKVIEYSRTDEAVSSVPKGVTTVILPTNLKEIQYGTFLGCTFLTSIKLPNSIEEIRDRAFSGCESLTEITIPNKVKKIGVEAFDLCGSLNKITLPAELEVIKYNAFQHCYSLESIEIPATIKEIGVGTFAWCSKLHTIKIAALKPPKMEPRTVGKETIYDIGTPKARILVPASALAAYKSDRNWGSQLNTIMGY